MERRRGRRGREHAEVSTDRSGDDEEVGERQKEGDKTKGGEIEGWTDRKRGATWYQGRKRGEELLLLSARSRRISQPNDAYSVFKVHHGRGERERDAPKSCRKKSRRKEAVLCMKRG